MNFDSIDYIAGCNRGLELAAQLVSDCDDRNGDWKYDDREELAYAIRANKDLSICSGLEEFKDPVVNDVDCRTCVHYSKKDGWNSERQCGFFSQEDGGRCIEGHGYLKLAPVHLWTYSFAKECFCPKDKCQAPVVFGRQTKCLRSKDDVGGNL